MEIVPHSARTGHLVAEVVAEDADSGANAWFSYHISQVSDSSLFQISANMGGPLTAHLVLPTDAVRRRVVVVVRDHGDPSLSASVALGALLSNFSLTCFLTLRKPGKQEGTFLPRTCI